jgi:glycosyltransferase involved in cell wall biosynthesis
MYMQPYPRITIVTPNLNQGRFLAECLESVIAQGYPRLQHIVIDGGSTDVSATVIDRYKDRLDYWCSEPDGGQSDAINKGLRRATGDLVAWLNADDLLLPHALERVAQAYAKNDRAPFYFGNGLRIDAQGATKSEFFPSVPVTFDREALIYGLNYVLQPSTFMRRAALLECGWLDETLRWGMDTDLWIRLSAAGQPAFVEGLLSASREYGETKTSTGMFERVEELRRIAERHSGAAMTPGVLCYYLDTLHRFSGMRGDVFDAAFRSGAIEKFWARAATQLARFGARDDGFPLGSGRPGKTRR